RIEPVDRASGNRRERLRALGRFLQRRIERLALPPLFGGFSYRFHIPAIIADRSCVPAPRSLDLPAHRTLGCDGWTRRDMAAANGSIFSAMLQAFDGAARILRLEPGIR